MPESTCAVCGAPNPPPSGNGRQRKFCSRRCNGTAHRDSKAATCSTPECDRPVRAKGFCNAHYKAQHPNRKLWKKNGKPEVRRAALRKKDQRRRARMKGDPDASLIDRDEVGARDGWRCGLCRKCVDPTLAYPSPQSPSLDHIVPLSLGGKHALSNVQISHLACNVAKGNRAADVQPLLVG